MTADTRVLCVRRGGLGDTLLCVPLLRAMRARWPAAALEFAGVREYGEVLLAHGVVDAVRSSEDLQVWALGQEGAVGEGARLRLQRYRVVVGDTAELLAGRVSGCEVSVFDPIPEADAVHAADWPLVQLGWPPGPTADLLADRIAPAAGAPAALHPGSGSRSKCWPRPNWERLALELESRAVPVLVVVGPAEQERDDPRRWTWPRGTRFAAGLTPQGLAGALATMRALVGNDSGISHLAAGLRVPTVAVFGPTDPARWAPRGEHVRVVGAPCTGPPRAAVGAVLGCLEDLGITP